jgi:ATP-dependent helicase/nuclease subunit B
VPPVLPQETVAGGAATVQWQMVEPFGAFALGRLGVSTLRPIVPGLPPIIRGNLIHGAAYQLYADRPSQEEIRDWLNSDLEQRIGNAVNKAFARYERYTDGVLKELLGLERQRVARLLAELVEVDLGREAFHIQSVEHATEFVMAGVRLGLRIDRIDRYDDGAVAILDYKTGGRRKFLDKHGDPADAQLVVYAMATEEPVAALGFFNIDSRETALDGSGRGPMGADEWQDALAKWSREVAAAASEFAAGDIRIRYWQTLRDARTLNVLSRFGELRRDA